MDYITCIDETPTGPVSPNRYYLNSGHVSRLQTCYRYARTFGYVDVTREGSPQALAICGDSKYPRETIASKYEPILGR